MDENLIENSATLGAYAIERLKKLAGDGHVKEVRGKGLWIGIELHQSSGGARRFCEVMQHRGVLCKETHVHVIRLAPPLVINREQLDWALDIIESTLAAEDPKSMLLQEAVAVS